MSIEGKSEVVASKCVLESSGSHGAVVCSPSGSTFHACQIQENEAGNILVEKHGRLSLQRCQILGSRWLHGASVWSREAGSIVITEGSISSWKEALIKASDQSKITLTLGTLADSEDGIKVEDEASATVTESTISNCRSAGIRMTSHARATGSDNEFVNNGVGGALEGNSHLELTHTTMRGNKAVNLSLTHEASARLFSILVHDSNTGISLSGFSHASFDSCHVHTCEIGIALATEGHVEAAGVTHFEGCLVTDCSVYGVWCGRRSSAVFDLCEVQHSQKACIGMGDEVSAEWL